MSIENMKKIADSIEQNIEPDEDLQVIEVLDLLHQSRPNGFCTDRNVKLYDTDLIFLKKKVFLCKKRIYNAIFRLFYRLHLYAYTNTNNGTNYINKGGIQMKNNEKMKLLMKSEKIALWRVAEKLGTSEWTLGRWLRHQVSKELEAKILEAIKQICTERG